LPKEVREEYKEAVLCPGNGEVIKYANQCPPPHGVFHMSEQELHRIVDTRHNVCYLQLTGVPYLLLMACKNIKKGERLMAHYGSDAGHRLREAGKEVNRS